MAYQGVSIRPPKQTIDSEVQYVRLSFCAARELYYQLLLSQRSERLSHPRNCFPFRCYLFRRMGRLLYLLSDSRDAWQATKITSKEKCQTFSDF